eukprot:6203566-Pleurochrysis_carterae.AAC.2
MRLNYNLSLLLQDELRQNFLLNERVVQWELGSARLNKLGRQTASQEEMLAATDVAGPLSDNATSGATAPAQAVKPVVPDESERGGCQRIPSLQAPV